MLLLKIMKTKNTRYASATLLNKLWWAMTGSNRRHPACKAGALPAELIAQFLIPNP